MALNSSCHVEKLPIGRGVCHEAHLSVSYQSSSLLAPVRTGQSSLHLQGSVNGIGVAPLLVRVFGFHIIETPRVLFGFRGNSLNRGENLLPRTEMKKH